MILFLYQQIFLEHLLRVKHGAIKTMIQQTYICVCVYLIAYFLKIYLLKVQLLGQQKCMLK